MMRPPASSLCWREMKKARWQMQQAKDELNGKTALNFECAFCPLKIRKDKGQYKTTWKILHVKIKDMRRNEKILQQKEDIKRLDNDS